MQNRKAILSLETRVSKAGNDYTILLIKSGQFEKEVFIDKSEIQLLRLLEQIDHEKHGDDFLGGER